jgi:ubiquinone/menaquinone biosynthesis C-methylase UbiE
MSELNQNSYTQKIYLNKDRWVSYFWQTNLISKYSDLGDKILEIGVGNNMVANFLKENYDLKTVDINPKLNPNIVSSVENLSEISDNSFESVLCAEVLEHLSFDKFEKCLTELKRVSKKYIIISLPYWGYTFGIKIKLPILGTKKLKFKISGIKKHYLNKSTAGHYWEIGKKNYPLKKIKKIFKNNNLKIIKSFWDLDDPYHYYFVLNK